MEGPRIQRPTTPAQRVEATRDGAKKRRDEEAPEFHLEDGGERQPLPENERERGEVAGTWVWSYWCDYEGCRGRKKTTGASRKEYGSNSSGGSSYWKPAVLQKW